MKLTAVDWLMENLHTAKDPFTQAKEMEKQQIENAFRIGATTELTFGDNKAEQYYIKEYGGEL